MLAALNCNWRENQSHLGYAHCSLLCSSQVMAFAFMPSKEDLNEFRIKLLIIASENVCVALKTALLSSDLIKRKPFKLIVHQSENCSIIPKSESLHLDFVVFVVDCRVPRAVKKVYEDVRILPPELAFGRFCVINATFNDTEISEYLNAADKLENVFRVNFNAHIVNGQLNTPGDFADMASRVIRLVSHIVDLP